MITFTASEQAEILTDALEIDAQLTAIQVHMSHTGCVIPMRTLGHWEEMRLDQRDIIFAELKTARAVATRWNMSDY